MFQTKFMTDSAHVQCISAIFEFLLSFFPFNISCLTNAMMSGQTNFVNTNISLSTTIEPFLPCWEFPLVNDQSLPKSVWLKTLFLTAKDFPIDE